MKKNLNKNLIFIFAVAFASFGNILCMDNTENIEKPKYQFKARAYLKSIPDYEHNSNNCTSIDLNEVKFKKTDDDKIIGFQPVDTLFPYIEVTTADGKEYIVNLTQDFSSRSYKYTADDYSDHPIGEINKIIIHPSVFEKYFFKHVAQIFAGYNNEDGICRNQIQEKHRKRAKIALGIIGTIIVGGIAYLIYKRKKKVKRIEPVNETKQEDSQEKIEHSELYDNYETNF